MAATTAWRSARGTSSRWRRARSAMRRAGRRAAAGGSGGAGRCGVPGAVRGIADQADRARPLRAQRALCDRQFGRARTLAGGRRADRGMRMTAVADAALLGREAVVLKTAAFCRHFRGRHLCIAWPDVTSTDLFVPGTTGFLLLCCLALVVFVNVLTFALFGLDKSRAVQGGWRIPERDAADACVPGRLARGQGCAARLPPQDAQATLCPVISTWFR